MSHPDLAPAAGGAEDWNRHSYPEDGGARLERTTPAGTFRRSARRSASREFPGSGCNGSLDAPNFDNNDAEKEENNARLETDW